MAKSQLNLRISDHTKRQLDNLTEHMGSTQTDVISIAIDRLHQQEIIMTYDFNSTEDAWNAFTNFQTASEFAELSGHDLAGLTDEQAHAITVITPTEWYKATGEMFPAEYMEKVSDALADYLIQERDNITP